MIAGDILGERARLTPDKVALVFVPSGERFTYAELNRRAIRCANMWLERGIGRGDRVGILSENRPEYVEAFFAAAKTGAILVPLSTRMTPRELEAMVRDCSPSLLMYSPQYAATASALLDAIRIEHRVALEEVHSGQRPEPHRFTPHRCDPEDLHCLLYTSGTTGKPKGVMVPHRMVAFNGYNTVASWQLRDDDVAQVFTPMYHAGGLFVFLVPLFTISGTIVLHDRFDASEVWRVLERERCTVGFGVPTIFKILMEAPEFATVDLSHVRWLISGGAPLPAYIIEAYQRRGVTFKQGYGLTEVGVNCFAMTGEESARKAGSIGKPMLHTQARLVGSGGGDVADDEVGELWLRGLHVCQGYWRNPEATAAALDGDGWFHTGDLARRDGEGFFYIAGRLKDMIISGGVNIYPAEIEAALLQHAAVQDAAVVGVPHETWGEVGVAWVVRRATAQVSSGELTAWLAARLGKYKLPREIRFVEELPRTAYGKVIKPELRERYLKEKPPRQQPEATPECPDPL
jgi:fatty-acyl-CoA synthase